jgi:hypothetical protein
LISEKKDELRTPHVVCDKRAMKNLRLNFNYCRKIFSLLLITFLVNTAAAEQAIFAAPNLSFQQTNKTRKSTKKKTVAKKVMNKKKSTSVAAGAWGGTGIGFVVAESGVQIEYDCAEAEIKGKLLTDENGNFNVKGFYKRQTPVLRVNLIPKPQEADFQGKISGSTMKLKVILTQTKEIIGEFTLTRDAAPRIRKCR